MKELSHPQRVEKSLILLELFGGKDGVGNKQWLATQTYSLLKGDGRKYAKIVAGIRETLRTQATE